MNKVNNAKDYLNYTGKASPYGTFPITEETANDIQIYLRSRGKDNESENHDSIKNENEEKISNNIQEETKKNPKKPLIKRVIKRGLQIIGLHSLSQSI